MLEHLLDSFGFVARAVASGHAAVELLRSEAFDVILVDWEMDGMDGAGIVRLLASEPAKAMHQVVPMVIESARESIEQMMGQMKIPAILSKPVNPVLLLDTVLAALGFETVPPPSSAFVPAPQSEAARRIRGTRVLVVDDNVINQQVAREVLMRAGVRVALAGGGAEAIAIVEEGAFDAVLMDIQMPGMDGYEATARIRTKPQHGHLPVIAMTAHAVAGFRESSMARGMNDYVTKPIDAERLYAVLANWIHRVPDDDAIDVPSYVTSQPAQPAPGIDVAAALERLGGNSRLLTVLLERFVEEFETAAQRVTFAIEQADYEAAGLLVHKIRGAAANLSMPELHSAASELELLLSPPHPDRLEEPLANFGFALDLVLEGIRMLDDVDGLEAAWQ
jgi:CheY-like chemotaxis protein